MHTLSLHDALPICIGSGTPTVASMTLRLSGVVRALVPYSLTNYTGQAFRVTFSGDPTAYPGNFADGIVDL